MTSSEPRRRPDAPEVLLADAVPAAAGHGVDIPVAVTHHGARAARIRITVFGLDSRWVPEPLDLGIVQPGQQVAITVTVVPERGTMGAHYPFTVAAEASDGRTRPVVGVAESVLILDAAERVSMAIKPSLLSAVFSRRITVEITNPGETDRTLRLVPDTVRGISVRLRHASVTAAAQATTRVAGRVTVRKPTITGGQNTHTFTVTAQGEGAPEYVSATVRSKPMFGSGLQKLVGLIVVAAVWIGLAIVFIPKISDKFAPKNDIAVTADSGPGGGGDAEAPDGSGGADGAGGVGGVGGAGAGGAADGSDDGAGPAGGYQLSGAVTGPAAEGSSVTLAAVSLATQDDGSLPDAQQPDSSAAVQAFRRAAPDAIGKTVGPVAPVAQGFRTTTIVTGQSGEFTFGGVTAPGYYLLTIGQAGFQTQRFLINSQNLASPQPLKVELASGEGKLSGRVVDSGGAAIGAASIVVTDGTVTLQTSSVSASTHSGTPGTWSLDQVSTPGTYLVTASAPGFGSSSQLVELPASGSATVDLSLSSGQSSITGKVSGEDDLGQMGGLGGITVTATGGGITRTATTVTAAAIRGTFVLSNLPAPGTYTLTISGAGYLTQTRDITLGANSVSVKTTLSRADGAVTGMVTGIDEDGAAEGGLGGVGLTLASNELTMKTMTTSGEGAGSFQFVGVPPGSYVLTATQFGRISESTPVELKPSATERVKLALKSNIGGELPANAHIRGQVTDSRTGGPLTCDRSVTAVSAADCVATVTVTAPKDPADPSAGSLTYTSKATSALNFVYTIPDLDDPDHAGLPPGLYTVKVSAPGYEDALTHVQVAQGQTAPAPPASMPALGIISGTITTRVGEPPESCVVAVPIGVTIPKDLPTTCKTVTGGNTCEVNGISGAHPCALSSVGGKDKPPLGTYQIRGLTHGQYQMVLIPLDPGNEFVYTVGTVPTVTLELGADGQFNAVLDRLGRINVSVVELNKLSGALVPKEKVVVTATKINGDGVASPAAVTSDASGQAILKGLNGTYNVTGTFTPATGEKIVVTMQAEPTGLNQESNLTLVIAQDSGPIVGRVVVDSGGTEPEPVVGAVVTVNGVVGYDAQGANVGSGEVTTDADGCYAIVPVGWSGNDLKSPACPTAVQGTIGAANSSVGVLRNLTTGKDAILISDQIDVAVGAVTNRTAPAPLTNVTIAECASGCGARGRIVPAIHVKALPMSAAGLGMQLLGPAGFTAPPTSTVRIDVLSKPTNTGTVRLVPEGSFTGDGANGTYDLQLTFTDSLLNNAANMATVGRYQLRVSAQDFVVETVDLLCTYGTPTCRFVESGTETSIGSTVTLKRAPAISVDITGLATPRVDNWTKASVTQTSGPSLGTIRVVGNADAPSDPNDPASTPTSSGYLTFGVGNVRSMVVTPNTAYAFTVTVPGYGQNTISVTCGNNYDAKDCAFSDTLAPLPGLPNTTVKLDPTTEPGGGPLGTGAAVTATVTGFAGVVEVTIGNDGTVSWSDSRSGASPGQVLPGTYTITFSRAGFIDATASLSCSGASCTLAGTTVTDDGAAGFTVTLSMLPRPELTLKATLSSPQPAGDFTFGASAFAVYLDGTQTRLTTIGLGLSTGTVEDEGSGTGTELTATLTWQDSLQPFAGIASQQQYRVVATIDGFQQGEATIDCTLGGTCLGEITLASYPVQDSSAMLVTKVPATDNAVTFTVNTSSNVTRPTLREEISSDGKGTGNLVWQQGGALANVIAPGSYQIIASLANYQSFVIGPGTHIGTPMSTIPFTCPDSDDCDFPQIVMVRSTALSLVFEDSDGQKLATVDYTLKQNTTTVDEATTPNGATTPVSRPITSLDTADPDTSTWTDTTYTLDVRAAGYAFALGLNSNSTDVSCTNGATTVNGLQLLPGGTTTCTVKLTKMGTITGTTAWQMKSQGGENLNSAAIGGIGLKATLLDATTGDNTATTFVTTSASDGSFTITGGGKTLDREGLAAGDWKIETTGTSGRFEQFSGVVTIAADTYEMTETTDDDSDGLKWGLKILPVSGSSVSLVLTPVKVNLNVTFGFGTTVNNPEPSTITLTDKGSSPTTWTCVIGSNNKIDDNATSNFPVGSGTEVCSLLTGQNNKTVQFMKLPPGNYTVVVDYVNPGYSDVSLDFTVDPTAPQAATLKFSPSAQVSTVTGAFADANNTPITQMLDNARVELWKWNCPAQDSTCIAKALDGGDVVNSSVGNGHFELTNIVNGQYQAVVFAEGYAVAKSDQLNIVAGTQALNLTIRLRPTAATSLKFKVTLGGGTSVTGFEGAAVTLHAPQSPRQAPIPDLTGQVATGGIVSIPSAVQSGTYQVTVSPVASEAIPFPLTTTTTVEVTDSNDGAALDLSAWPLPLDGVPTTLSLSWTAVSLSCALPPEDGRTIGLALSQGSGQSQIDAASVPAAKVVSANNKATADTIYLPSGVSYSFGPATGTGWALASGGDFTIDSGASSQLADAVIKPATAPTAGPVTVTLTLDNEIRPGATVKTGSTTFADAGDGTYQACLEPGADYPVTANYADSDGNTWGGEGTLEMQADGSAGTLVLTLTPTAVTLVLSFSAGDETQVAAKYVITDGSDNVVTTDTATAGEDAKVSGLTPGATYTVSGTFTADDGVTIYEIPAGTTVKAPDAGTSGTNTIILSAVDGAGGGDTGEGGGPELDGGSGGDGETDPGETDPGETDPGGTEGTTLPEGG